MKRFPTAVSGSGQTMSTAIRSVGAPLNTDAKGLVPYAHDPSWSCRYRRLDSTLPRHGAGHQVVPLPQPAQGLFDTQVTTCHDPVRLLHQSCPHSLLILAAKIVLACPTIFTSSREILLQGEESPILPSAAWW